MYVLTREEMYALDKYTNEKAGIPGRELMEKAGKGCAMFIRDEIFRGNINRERGNINRENFRIALFCGSGNNGGDGFVIARYLNEWQFKPVVFMMGRTDKMSPETHENYLICKKNAIEIISIENTDFCLNGFHLVVDAIFGIGLQGSIQGWQAEVINKINNSNLQVIAIDIASGIDANTGNADVAIEADFTLTMAGYKFGHFWGKGREFSGETLVIDIGIPEQAYVSLPPQARLITDENVIFPSRSRFFHKGDYGKIGIIAGSPGYSGSAILAAKAALRAGAGMITLFHPAGMETIFESQLIEVMTTPLPENPESNIQFQVKLHSMDALLIGPGIGRSDYMRNLIKMIINNWHKPLVIDADALNIISANPSFQKNIKDNWILTPHLGEFARLTQKSISDIQSNPLQSLQEYRSQNPCNVLLKSSTKILSSEKGFWIDVSGNDGLATGGSGDVLAGIIVSFLGQKLPPAQAAISASYLMGETAERLSDIRKTAAIIPSDIIENIFKYKEL
jgi:NAD(P)H-hydrate epimerase